ncbi:hypothetical protein KBB41_01700 [Candidatus Curtissbacteria bacterium]|nr:hypothetical protein [Candidatus Curtissbacteria bacterium]
MSLWFPINTSVIINGLNKNKRFLLSDFEFNNLLAKIVDIIAIILNKNICISILVDINVTIIPGISHIGPYGYVLCVHRIK